MDNVNKWLMLLANLGVIAGILFLAVEIQQNNRLLRFEAIAGSLETDLRANELTASNETIARIQTKNNNIELLEPWEVQTVRSLFALSSNSVRKQYLLYQEGIISEQDLRESWARYKFAFNRSARTFTAHEWWGDRISSPAGTDLFVDLINQCVIKECEEIPQ